MQMSRQQALVRVAMLIRGVVMQIRNGRPPNDERAYGNDALLYAN